VVPPELRQQLLEADDGGIEGHEHGLGMAGSSGAHLPVVWVLDRATLVTGDGVDHAGHGPEELLDPPEAAGGERGPIEPLGYVVGGDPRCLCVVQLTAS